jgi:hypothetical protein
MPTRKNNATDELIEPSPAVSSRRAALRSAVRMTGALGVLGLSSSALLTPREARAEGSCGGLSPDHPVAKLVHHALTTYDMNEAIDLYAEEAELSSAAIDALQQITSEDLAQFMALRASLGAALEEKTGSLSITIQYHNDI